LKIRDIHNLWILYKGKDTNNLLISKLGGAAGAIKWEGCEDWEGWEGCEGWESWEGMRGLEGLGEL